MAKSTNEIIMAKKATLEAVEEIMNEVAWRMKSKQEHLDDVLKRAKEYADEYDADIEGVPLDEDWRYKDYLQGIETDEQKIRAFEAIETALMKLI